MKKRQKAAGGTSGASLIALYQPSGENIAYGRAAAKSRESSIEMAKMVGSESGIGGAPAEPQPKNIWRLPSGDGESVINSAKSRSADNHSAKSWPSISDYLEEY